ncbi:MAG: GMC family oxidoreductase N-terminal domain-containing protein [Acidobacteriota bacterium]
MKRRDFLTLSAAGAIVPARRRAEAFQESRGQDGGAEPDYIVVGAGSSGCVIVNRLSADPDIRVLLIEAGASGEADAAVTTPGRWVSLLGSQYDWAYTTEPEPALANRRIGFPRGKALGGSSAINAMTHIRGHRLCFDRWQAAGNPGWSHDDLLPFFKRSERNDGGGSGHRGGDGPLAVSRGLDPHAGHQAFLEAASQQGFRADARHDFNVPEPEGVAGFYQKNILNGRRHSAAAAFLVPALARPNLEVQSSARVTRLIAEGRRIVGVEYVQDGRRIRARARREVVLCAGAVDSPRLLMLSGIGAADPLRALGIAVVANLTGVGQNLQDHPKLSVRWTGRTMLPGSTVTAGLFTSSRSETPPDLQFYVGRGVDQPDAFVTITVSLVRPQSRGTITLRSAEPFDAPLIHANYLQAQADVDALVQGARLARLFGASTAYDQLRADEVAPGRPAVSTADLEQFARQQVDTIYHPAGTCRMGPASDALAVVDAQLRVHGVEGVRVADASIMPEVVNATTHAACIAIGEKCAALITQAKESPARPPAGNTPTRRSR